MSDMRRGSAVGRDHGDNWDVMTKQSSRSEPEGWMDGFRRAEKLPRRFQNAPYKQTLPPVITAVTGSRDYDLGAANIKTANTLLARELKGRHLQMIAFGGAIGKRQMEGGICSLMLIARRRNRPLRSLWQLPLHRWTGQSLSVLLYPWRLAIQHYAVTGRTLRPISHCWFIFRLFYQIS